MLRVLLMEPLQAGDEPPAPAHRSAPLAERAEAAPAEVGVLQLRLDRLAGLAAQHEAQGLSTPAELRGHGRRPRIASPACRPSVGVALVAIESCERLQNVGSAQGNALGSSGGHQWIDWGVETTLTTRCYLRNWPECQLWPGI
jgi:hypothetical protein